MAKIVNRPLSHTVARVCELTGYGPTSVWKLIADGKLDVVRVPGLRRTLITDASLMRLLAPAPAESRPYRRPRKKPAGAVEQTSCPR
jgi:hypothetical protein